jgi:hypothetical protein
MRIVWTAHAIERVGQRFGFSKEIQIPNAMMFRMGRNGVDGQKFRLGCGDVVYIFVKDGDVLTIVTVHRRENENYLKKFPKSRGYDVSQRRSGKRVKEEEYSI